MACYSPRNCFDEVIRLLKFIVATVLLGSSSVLYSQTVAHSTGSVHTTEVELGYETFGSPTEAMPVIAVNGGPGLSHVYMLQNDMWQKVAQRRLVVFYDQRGTGASKHMRRGAPQTMDAQVKDLEAVRARFSLTKFALVGDSYGGLLAMAYAAEHQEQVGKLVLSDSAAPSWAKIVHLLPQTFPTSKSRVPWRQRNWATRRMPQRVRVSGVTSV